MAGGLSGLLAQWSAQLTDAGVPNVTDSRGQFSTPAGWVLLSPAGAELSPAVVGRFDAFVVTGEIYICAEGPWGSAQAVALDAFLPRVLLVLRDYFRRVYFPDSITLASLGVDVPAAAVEYSGVIIGYEG